MTMSVLHVDEILELVEYVHVYSGMRTVQPHHKIVVISPISWYVDENGGDSKRLSIEIISEYALRA